MEVKDIIRNRRIELGYTMKQVADFVGVSEATISRWESGDIANMKRDKISALAKALNLSPAVIMEWDDTVQKNGLPEYYYNPDTREFVEFLHKNPDYKALFDAARDVRPEDLDFVRQFIERMGGKSD